MGPFTAKQVQALMSTFPAQFTNENILILDAVMHSLDFYYNETFDIKQYRLRRMRELGLLVNLEFLSSVGVRPHHLIVDSLVRASDVSVAPRECDVAGLFASSVSANWSQAYSATVQLLQQGFYSDDLRFTEARTSWAQVVQNARTALQAEGLISSRGDAPCLYRSCSQSDVNL